MTRSKATDSDGTAPNRDFQMKTAVKMLFVDSSSVALQAEVDNFLNKESCRGIS